MGTVQKPSISAVVQDQTPELGGNLDCQDFQINNAGRVQWYDAALSFQASVLFGNTLYFQPSVNGQDSNYIFRGVDANRTFRIQHLPTQVRLHTGAWNSEGLRVQTNNNNSEIEFRSGIGTTVNLLLESSGLGVFTQGLDLRDGVNSQQLNVYGSYTDASNYSRLEMRYDGNNVRVEAKAAGTGASPVLFLNGDNGVRIESVGQTSMDFTSTGARFWQDCRPVSDSAYTTGTDTLRWLNTYTDTITIGDGVNAVLTADADNELALRNGTNAQQLNVYNTDDGTNYERLEFRWDSDTAYIETTSGGTGSSRNLYLRSDGDSGVQIKTNAVDIYANNWNTAAMTFGASSIRAYKPIIPINDSNQYLGSTGSRFAYLYTDEVRIGDGVDAILTADAADTLALRNGANAQTLNLYATYTDDNNYERLHIGFDGTSYLIRPKLDGTGSPRMLKLQASNNNASSFELQANGNSAWKYGNTQNLYVGGGYVRASVGFQPTFDGTIDNGKDTLRWATTYTNNLDTKAVINSSIQTITSTGQIAATDTMNLIDATSGVTIVVLPAASSLPTGLEMTFKKIDSSANTAIIDAQTGDTIDGQPSVNLSSQYDVLKIINDGSNWHILYTN